MGTSGVLVVGTAAGSAVPGGGEVGVPLRVRNTGDVVDRFTCRLTGAPAGWGAVEPAVLALLPHEEGTAVAVFRPPLGVEAGTVAFAVVLGAESDPTFSLAEEGSVDVAPVTAVTAVIRPTTSRGRRRGQHELTVVNAGNQAVQVQVEANDADDLLTLRCQPTSIEVGVGERVAVAVTADAGRRSRTTETLPFQVMVTAGGADAQVVDASFRQDAAGVRWGLVAAAVALVALLVAAALVLRQRDDDDLATGAGQAAPIANTVEGGGDPSTTGTTAATGTGPPGSGALTVPTKPVVDPTGPSATARPAPSTTARPAGPTTTLGSPVPPTRPTTTTAPRDCGTVAPSTSTFTAGALQANEDVAVATGRPIQIAPLANDRSASGQMVVTTVSAPLHGTVTLNAAGTLFRYVPSSGYTGQDAFSYTVADKNGGSASGSVSIGPGTAQQLGPTVEACAGRTRTLLDVTTATNGNPGDKLVLTAASEPTVGTIDLSPDGSTLRYTAPPTPGGSASVPYVVSDARGGTSAATIQVQVT